MEQALNLFIPQKASDEAFLVSCYNECIKIMATLTQQLTALSEQVTDLAQVLNLAAKKEQVAILQGLQQSPDFWQDQAQAVKVGRELEKLQKEIAPFESLEQDILNVQELSELALNDDEELVRELGEKTEQLTNRFKDLEFYSLLSGPYDEADVILSIHAGTGGVDAQDFAQMLERMYLRFCEGHDFKAEVMERTLGNEAGIKSVLLKISGTYAYGYFKSEHGAHRLVRISPFDGESLRQTSFALVEAIPELGDDVAIDIKDEDLKIDLFRSSGPGGQSVNKTESAVRITHLPTGLVVACQSERSQHQNKANALGVLKARLHQRALQERAGELQEIKGGVTTASWGRQVRSYVLQPYQMVKDHRTEYETSDVNGVLDGDLQPFMEAYLRQTAAQGA